MLCVTVKRIDERSTSENLFKGVRKNKRSQRKTRFFCPYWKTSNKLSRDKNKIQKNIIMFKLAAKARETAKRAASCAFAVNLEKAMVPLK